MHPDVRRLYIANENDNLVSMIDTVERRIVAEIPVGVEPESMTFSPDGAIIVNTSETTSMVHFIDAATNEVSNNVLVDTRLRAARFSADGKRPWVPSEIRGRISVIDGASLNILAMIEFTLPGIGPELEIDQQTFEVHCYYLVEQRVSHLALSPDESRLYTTNGNSGDVSVIDLRNDTVIKLIPAGGAPWGVVAAP